MSLYNLISPYKNFDVRGFIPVYAGSEKIGLVPADFARGMAGINDTWLLQNDSLILNPSFSDYKSRSDAVDASCFLAIEKGLIPPKPDYPHGDDWFGVGRERQTKPLFIIRRFFAVCFGIEFDTVIVNGYEDGEFWCAIRGKEVEIAPGKLDTIIAGAFHHGQTPIDALYYEGHQEAGLTKEWLDKIVLAKTIQVCQINRHGFLRDEIFYIYDFDTRGEFVPVSDTHWEVEGFKKLPYASVLKHIEQSDFKGEIHLTVLDFLIRHNFLTADHPEYKNLVELIDKKKDFYG